MRQIEGLISPEHSVQIGIRTEYKQEGHGFVINVQTERHTSVDGDHYLLKWKALLVISQFT